MPKPIRAFTLIELLIVISIIAILAAIMFPVFAQAKASAKTSSCLSNTKQIGLGWMMYANDYDDVMPLAETVVQVSPDGGRYWTTWFGETYYPAGAPAYTDFTRGEIYPYTKNAQIFQCPSSQLNRLNNTEISYGVNVDIVLDCDVIVGQQTYGPGTCSDLKKAIGPNFSEIQSTSETILLGDAIGVGDNGAYDSTQLDASPSANHGLAYGVHGGFANLAWCDGHSKAKKTNAVQMLGNAWTSGQALTAIEASYNAGVIWKTPPPSSLPSAYGTPSLAPAAYYYLMNKQNQ